jgi:hypothetical protein
LCSCDVTTSRFYVGNSSYVLLFHPAHVKGSRKWGLSNTSAAETESDSSDTDVKTATSHTLVGDNRTKLVMIGFHGLWQDPPTYVCVISQLLQTAMAQAYVEEEEVIVVAPLMATSGGSYGDPHVREHPCDILVPFLQHPCNTLATPLLHPCYTLVTPFTLFRWLFL